MRYDRKTFYAYARNAPFGGRLSTQQVNGMEAILNEWDASGRTDERWLAYAFATTFWETAQTMQPIIETRQPSESSNPSVDTAIARLNKAKAAGKLPWVTKTPYYWTKDKQGRSWLGRGFVQLTHYENYLKAGTALGIDLVANPDRAMDIDVAVKVLFVGMEEGWFAGDKVGRHKFSRYFNDTTEDPEGARRIINGTDKAKLIAGYYKNFLDAIRAAMEAEKKNVRPPEVTTAAATPDDIPASQSVTGYVLPSIPAVGALAAPLIGGVNNVYSLIFSLALLAFAGVLIALFATGKISIGRTK